MQIHDWTRVAAGTFHDFHSSWITHLKEALNLNLLPPGFYAMAVVAMIEIISPGNKDGSRAIHEFVTKSIEVMDAGIHLLVVDLFPTSACNPEGIHALLWDDPFSLPADRRLTLASYRIDVLNEAFVEPIAVGQEMRDMPIFLDPAWYVNVPLASTYESAWRGVPKPFQRMLEAT